MLNSYKNYFSNATVYCKVVRFIDYFIVLCALYFLSGCIAPYVRYTRPSYRSRRQESKTVSPEKEKIVQAQDTSISEVSESRLKRIVDSYIGVRYKYGGTTRKGMDCSGFVWRVYTQLGKKNLPRTSSKLSRMGTSVSRKELRIGDLVFFRKRRRIDHVGIYMGNNTFTHASSKKGVIYTSLDNEYFRNRLICIRRID